MNDLNTVTHNIGYFTSSKEFQFSCSGRELCVEVEAVASQSVSFFIPTQFFESHTVSIKKINDIDKVCLEILRKIISV